MSVRNQPIITRQWIVPPMWTHGGYPSSKLIGRLMSDILSNVLGIKRICLWARYRSAKFPQKQVFPEILGEIVATPIGTNSTERQDHMNCRRSYQSCDCIYHLWWKMCPASAICCTINQLQYGWNCQVHANCWCSNQSSGMHSQSFCSYLTKGAFGNQITKIYFGNVSPKICNLAESC